MCTGNVHYKRLEQKVILLIDKELWKIVWYIAVFLEEDSVMYFEFFACNEIMNDFNKIWYAHIFSFRPKLENWRCLVIDLDSISFELWQIRYDVLSDIDLKAVGHFLRKSRKVIINSIVLA